MDKILISLPNQLVTRMRATIPPRQRSKIIAKLIEQEVTKREYSLYECAAALEKDAALTREMREWDSTTNDGLDDESW